MNQDIDYRLVYFSDEWLEIRQKILYRDNYKCHICDYSGHLLLVHHIIPLRDGGTNNPDNLVTLCNYCHPAVEHRSLNRITRERIIKMGKTESWFYEQIDKFGSINSRHWYKQEHRTNHVDIGLVKLDCKLCIRLVDNMAHSLLFNPETVIPLDIKFQV